MSKLMSQPDVDEVVVEGREVRGFWELGDEDWELPVDDRHEEFHQTVDVLVQSVDGNAVVELVNSPL